jgi:hypothetical protein
VSKSPSGEIKRHEYDSAGNLRGVTSNRKRKPADQRTYEARCKRLKTSIEAAKKLQERIKETHKKIGVRAESRRKLIKVAFQTHEQMLKDGKDLTVGDMVVNYDDALSGKPIETD